MKKIINDLDKIVSEMAMGIVKANPDQLTFNSKYRYISRKHKKTDKVTLISGGGSGHEPAHAGFVGEGMLDCAVCGDIFASPSSMQIYNAISDNSSPAGTLLIIKNYSGDCMNFDSAAELAADDELVVEKVYVNDDIAVEDSLYTVGRRGVAGTLFVHKLAGAASESGLSLPEVKAIAEKTILNTRSIGLALTSCTVPAKGSPTFTLSDDEIEFGVGIHGEPGIAREKLVSSKDLASKFCDKLFNDLKLSSGDEIAIMVNGLGSTPLMELYLFNNDVSDILQGNKIKIHKTLVGNYMTALDMSGLSLTFLKLDSELKTYLDAPTSVPSWK